jgi:hypothetical protein
MLHCSAASVTYHLPLCRPTSCNPRMQKAKHSNVLQHRTVRSNNVMPVVLMIPLCMGGHAPPPLCMHCDFQLPTTVPRERTHKLAHPRNAPSILHAVTSTRFAAAACAADLPGRHAQSCVFLVPRNTSCVPLQALGPPGCRS